MTEITFRKNGIVYVRNTTTSLCLLILLSLGPEGVAIDILIGIGIGINLEITGNGMRVHGTEWLQNV